MVDCVTSLAPNIIGRPLRTPREDLFRALDPVNFVNIRAIPGGPAPQAVLTAIQETETEAAEDQRWIRGKSTRLQDYPARIRDLCGTLLDRAKWAEQT